MRRHLVLPLLIAGLYSTTSCGHNDRHAECTLKDPSGQQVARATFDETVDGVRVRVKAHALPKGSHGMHVHESGQCDPPDFASAGAHFNPFGGMHAAHHESGSHAGDLPNINVGSDGSGSVDAVLRGVHLRGGGHHSLVRGHGTSLIIHANEDQGGGDPSGNSGQRIACGVVRLSKAESQ
jgi:superoxide dismutase, Cu-Zn family